MTVTLLAYPALTDAALELLAPDDGTTTAELLAVIAGRECYDAFGRRNPATAADRDYLANIIEQEHFSVFAHPSFSWRLSGVSRRLTHELIRHRFLAFSELSQRYVDMSGSYTVVPPLFRGDEIGEHLISANHEESLENYDALVARGEHLAREQGLDGRDMRKAARQAAAYVLPGGTETRIIVSGNVRAVRDLVVQRNSPDADAEIREMAAAMLDDLRVQAPSMVVDLVEAAAAVAVEVQP